MLINQVPTTNPKEFVIIGQCVGDTTPRLAISADGAHWRGNGTTGPARKTDLVVPLVTAPLTLTNALQADGFINADASYEWCVDLAAYSQVRLTARISTASASANSPKLQLRYSATQTSTVANKLIMGSTSVEVSMFTGQVLADSGWIDMVSGARIDSCFLGLMNIGGDGVADPVVNQVIAHFR